MSARTNSMTGLRRLIVAAALVAVGATVVHAQDTARKPATKTVPPPATKTVPPPATKTAPPPETKTAAPPATKTAAPSPTKTVTSGATPGATKAAAPAKPVAPVTAPPKPAPSQTKTTTATQTKTTSTTTKAPVPGGTKTTTTTQTKTTSPPVQQPVAPAPKPVTPPAPSLLDRVMVFLHLKPQPTAPGAATKTTVVQNKTAAPPAAPVTQNKTAAPGTKSVTPPLPQTKAGAAQTKTAPVQTKTAAPPTNAPAPQTKAGAPQTKVPAAQPAATPTNPPASVAGQTKGAAPGATKTVPTAPAGGAGPRQLNVVTSDTALAKPLVIMREVFTYDPAGRRDPFLSLLTTTDLRPTLSDLKLIGTVVDEPGRSVALLQDNNAKKQWTVRVGTKLGRMRVSTIRANVVVFSIDEFGMNRLDSLLLRDTTKVRGR